VWAALRPVVQRFAACSEGIKGWVAFTWCFVAHCMRDEACAHSRGTPQFQQGVYSPVPAQRLADAVVSAARNTSCSIARAGAVCRIPAAADAFAAGVYIFWDALWLVAAARADARGDDACGNRPRTRHVGSLPCRKGLCDAQGNVAIVVSTSAAGRTISAASVCPPC